MRRAWSWPKSPRRLVVAVVAILALLVSCAIGCFSYSSYQDARIVPEGESQATLSVSASSYADRFSSENTYWYPIELAPRFHLAQRFDAGFARVERATG
jgi:hypothetical protein